MSRGGRLRSARGFTLVEMLIATTIMVIVTGAVFQLLNPAQGTYQTQPEVADMQQRLRVGVDSLAKDLVMAGAGAYMGGSTGSLANYFPPIHPYRVGDLYDDRDAGIFFRPDAITLLYVPPTPGQAIVDTIGNNSQELYVYPQPNCADPSRKIKNVCGFKEGQRALIFDANGKWDTMTITRVQESAMHLQHSGKLSGTYDKGNLTEVAAHTYYLKTDVASKRFQLMHYDGYRNDTPVVDNVVKLEFQYFGDPQPPQMLPNKPLTDTVGPWTTYGPKPPGPAAETCIFRLVDGRHVPRLPVLGDGVSQVALTESMLTDGPWCPDAASPVRFDADLLRIRRIRVKLRVQVALESMRGAAGTLFVRGGTSSAAERFVPDQEISFDVAPRNMNLGR